jgi:broad specificity phosphatase PhoE
MSHTPAGARSGCGRAAFLPGATRLARGCSAPIGHHRQIFLSAIHQSGAIRLARIVAVTEQPRTTLHLVRHCDVHNPDGVLYGHLPGFRLSEKGVRQAHALGEHFAGRPVRQIYASPLERAQQTAHIIASYLDHPTVVTTPELVEARFGLYLQGIRPKDVPWRRPLWFVHMAWPGVLPNDEAVPAMAARVRAPMMRLLRDFPGEEGICVSHGDPIQAFWVEAEGRHAYALHRLQCAKGGMLTLQYEGGTLVSKQYIAPRDAGAPEQPAEAAGADASHA